MKKFNVLLVLVLMTVLTATASQRRKVLFIGIDGTRADALQTANTPNIDTLVAHGAYTFDSWCLGITVSGPSWSSIFTGVWYPKHGVTDNSYSGSHFDRYRLFPCLAKQHKPSLYAAEVMEWAPLVDNVPNSYDCYDVRVKVTDGGTTTTVPPAQTQLLNSNLDILSVYFDAVDLAGHSSGFSPSNAAYINAIQAVDAAIGNILTSLRARTNYATEDWLILLTTDHGGTGTGHGGNSVSERHIWWIGAGTNITHRQLNVAGSDPGTYRVSPYVDTNVLKSVPVQTDIAVTALHFLTYDLNLYPGIRAADSLDGRSWLDSIYVPAPPAGVAPAVKTLTEELVVFPNPVNNILTMWFENAGKHVTYTVTNEAGSVVMIDPNVQMNGLKLNIDLSSQPAGNYIVRLKVGNEVAERKITVIH
ncbi:MAG: T9SS C-terminal target domain-containing protein [Chitinophagia bacterium]|nr:T9SS C-terminal target domain-containing protein [Chitinophagia bacterium]